MEHAVEREMAGSVKSVVTRLGVGEEEVKRMLVMMMMAMGMMMMAIVMIAMMVVMMVMMAMMVVMVAM